MENLLRQVNCQITIPFWNTPLNAKTLFEPSPGYHMWDVYGGFGSTDTRMKNGFTIETGTFKCTTYKNPTFFVNKLNQTARKFHICNVPHDTTHYSDFTTEQLECLKELNKTFHPECGARHKKLHPIPYDMTPSYEETYSLLHNKTLPFPIFEFFARNRTHAHIHDFLGRFLFSSPNHFFIFRGD